MGSDAEVDRVEEAEHLVAAIVLAFGADPFVRWLLPGSAQFLDTFTRVTRLHGLRTAAAGGAFGRRDGRGAALWYPPGVELDGPALGAVFESAGVVERIGAVWEHVAPYEPTEPYWYLRQLGVDPALQGRGAGSAVIEAGLIEIDRRGEPAYLEATSERGCAFYGRHGFETLAEVRVGDAAPLWPMLRRSGSS